MTPDALSRMLEGLRFDPDAVGMECVLGPLEARVMEVAWEDGEATIREIHRRLGGVEKAAYTTVATVAHRLEAKGLLRRRTADRRLFLSPTIRRPDFLAITMAQVLRGVLRQLRAGHPSATLGRLSAADQVLLRDALQPAASHASTDD